MLTRGNSVTLSSIGDFNELMHQSEKRGNHPHPGSLIEAFRQAVTDCGLSDLGYVGYAYTWERGRGTTWWVEERLDRALVSVDWKHLFNQSRLIHLSVSTSDHLPVLLELRKFVPRQSLRRFKYENSWSLEPQCYEVVRQSWGSNGDSDVMSKLVRCSKDLEDWGKRQRLKWKSRIKELKNQIEVLKWAGASGDVALLNHAEYELNLVLRQEEEYWKQRAKLFWLKAGDSNSRAFHLAASKRRSRNAIANLRGEDGQMYGMDNGAKQIVVDYFEQLFRSGGCDISDVQYLISPVISVEQNESLTRPFAVEEVKDALFAMHPDKSLGDDGFSPDSLNRTNIVFIPKKSEAQNAFVPGRSITDSILIAHEVLHFLKRKREGRIGYAALKIDISKAVARGAPTVSYLFFADNSYLFFKATESESRSLKQILLRYQNLSGQEINLNKSALTFSRNTDDVVKRGICSILQVEEQADPELEWSPFVESWKGNLLENGSSIIPTYVMQLLLLPKDLCRDIESMMNGFFWDSNPQCRSIRWMSWGKMCDSWLPDSSNRLIITPPVAGFDGIKVDELITEGLWREDFIRDKFMARDADLILSIPLPMSSREDQISWSFDARGEYTARSGYGALRCFRQSAALVASDVDSNFVWAQLWKVTTPPKILNFAWRAARNCLPTRFALTIRHVDTPMCCPIYRSEPETTLHVLVECVAARDVWDESGLAMLQEMMLFGMVEFGIRNRLLMVVFTMLESWFHANETLANAVTVPSYSSKWQKPDYGWIKINVDGAVFPDKCTIGAVFRDHQGRFMGGFAKPFPHQTLPEVVEALGVREVLSWIHERSRSKIVVETDCLRVVQVIQHRSCPNTSLDSLLQTV
ncbi:hypothetical protein CK203_105923 [Vitis vinifera]|uniref:RNase H type-1 domain-containing protein n=1 Tax=Vitis vinifera TaxID=29760 RepID=A0A438E6H1_VITVI|nr:hypothetical protein CK203_105923 [Vitis vinifera]